jgi:4-hydroxy-2-oxoglutarate aldolase
MNLRGIFPPIPTPFVDDEVDLPALRSNVRRWMQTPLNGIVVLGSNGEAPLLNEDESDRVIGTARDDVPRGRLLIAGTARESTRETVAATRRAAALGADAVLVRTPGFYKGRMTPDAMIRHYTAVADASAVPVILYNFPALTGVTLTTATVMRLAEHPNIAAIKESSGDIAQVGDLAAHAGSGFPVVVGSGHTLFASLAVGASGGVVALAAVAPELTVRLYELTVARKHDEAIALQRRLAPIAKSVTGVYGVPGLKLALDLIGYVGGDPRPPLGPAPPEAIEVIRQQIAALPGGGGAPPLIEEVAHQ